MLILAPNDPRVLAYERLGYQINRREVKRCPQHPNKGTYGEMQRGQLCK